MGDGCIEQGHGLIGASHVTQTVGAHGRRRAAVRIERERLRHVGVATRIVVQLVASTCAQGPGARVAWMAGHRLLRQRQGARPVVGVVGVLIVVQKLLH